MRAAASRLLHDYGLAALDLDLADARRQRKRIVEADAGRLLGRARVVADDFLQNELRDGTPPTVADSSSKRPTPLLVLSTPVAVTGRRPVR